MNQNRRMQCNRQGAFAQDLATREGQRPRCPYGDESRAAGTLPLTNLQGFASASNLSRSVWICGHTKPSRTAFPWGPFKNGRKHSINRIFPDCFKIISLFRRVCPLIFHFCKPEAFAAEVLQRSADQVKFLVVDYQKAVMECHACLH